MTLESNYWKSPVKAMLEPFGKLVRVENPATPGTPDVAYCLTHPRPGAEAAAGWIELKAIDGLPAKKSSPVVIEKLTLEQVRFAEDWAAAGGRAFLLLRAPPWHLLLNPAGIRGVYERRLTADDALAFAKVARSGTFPLGDILRILTA